MPNTTQESQLSAVTTQDAVQRPVTTITTQTDWTYFVQGKIIARDQATGDSKIWWATGCFRNVSGVVTRVASLANIMTPIGDPSTTTWVASVAVSGADILINVTGAAGVNIDWAGFIDLFRVD
jgi:hypothetical protein